MTVNLTTVLHEGVRVTLERTRIKILEDVDDIAVVRDPATDYWFPVASSIGSGGQGACDPSSVPQLTCEQGEPTMSTSLPDISLE